MSIDDTFANIFIRRIFVQCPCKFSGNHDKLVEMFAAAVGLPDDGTMIVDDRDDLIDRNASAKTPFVVIESTVAYDYSKHLLAVCMYKI